MRQASEPAGNDRLIFYQEEASTHSASFAEDVRAGMSATPKYIPPRWLYDDLGSALFEAIMLLPDYYLTATEAALLDLYSDEILASLDGPIGMIELGSGSGRKTRTLIEAAFRRQERLHYKPIDISSAALAAWASTLTTAYDDLQVTAFAGDYRKVMRSGLLDAPGRVLVLFLGSSIGNYEPQEARALLRAVSEGLKSGDALLLGVDLKKSRRELELAYNDPLGVTACFNRNILARVNRELGGRFELDAFDFVATYDEKRGCVDSFQESKRDQIVRIDELEREVRFARGERIHTESAYKYDRADIDALARESGFVLERTWTYGRERYALNLFAVRP